MQKSYMGMLLNGILLCSSLYTYAMNNVVYADDVFLAEDERETLKSSIQEIIQSPTADVNRIVNPYYNAHAASPLMLAIHYKCYDLIDPLLQKNPDINARDRKGRTAFHSAVATCQCLSKNEDKRFIILEKLINHARTNNLSIAASLNATCDGWYSPLCIVASSYCGGGQLPLIHLLLHSEANVNIQNNRWAETPLHIVARGTSYHSYDLQEKVINALYAYGACPSIKEVEQHTPLDFADREVTMATKLPGTFEELSQRQKTVVLISDLEKKHTAVTIHALKDIFRQPRQYHLLKQSFLYWLPKELQEPLLHYVVGQKTITCPHCNNMMPNTMMSDTKKRSLDASPETNKRLRTTKSDY